MDRNFDDRVQVAFVKIIRQLEVTDEHILHAAFLECVRIQEYFDLKPYPKRKSGWNSPLDIAIDIEKVRDALSVDELQFETSLDNLQRLRCLTPFVETKGFDGVSNGLPAKHLLSAFYSYEQISITALGISFVETCVRDAAFLSDPPCESWIPPPRCFLAQSVYTVMLAVSRCMIREISATTSCDPHLLPFERRCRIKSRINVRSQIMCRLAGAAW